MNPRYLLSSVRAHLPAALRTRPLLRRLKWSDSATRAMNDFQSDPPRTVVEDLAVDAVLDEMFRFGVRAFLVVRESTVVGLITAEDARRALRVQRSRPDNTPRLKVSEVMTASADVPAIDWQTLQDSRIGDLIEIFNATHVRHLVVLQGESASYSTVRGLIHRDRLLRQLDPSGGARTKLL